VRQRIAQRYWRLVQIHIGHYGRQFGIQTSTALTATDRSGTMLLN
jgi:hypothetical protein